MLVDLPVITRVRNKNLQNVTIPPVIVSVCPYACNNSVPAPCIIFICATVLKRHKIR